MAWQPEVNVTHGIFDPRTVFIGNMSLRGEISSAWAFSFNIERDNILWNSVDFRLKTRTDYFSFEFGAFTGMSDAFGASDMGILGSMELTWPGIMFFSIGGLSTIGTLFDFTGEDFRESAELKLGFWLPFVIPVLSMNTRSYTEHINNWVCRTTLTRLQLSAEFFNKTSPVSFIVMGGYQTLMRDYLVPVYENPADGISSLYLGFDFQYSIVKNFRIIIGGEVPVVLFPDEHLKLQNELAAIKYYFGFILSYF